MDNPYVTGGVSSEGSSCETVGHKSQVRHSLTLIMAVTTPPPALHTPPLLPSFKSRPLEPLSVGLNSPKVSSAPSLSSQLEKPFLFTKLVSPGVKNVLNEQNKNINIL